MTRQKHWVGLTIWSVVSLSLWFALVPGWISGAAFGWIIAMALALFATSITVVQAGRQSRSVAHVLYDVEHQNDVGMSIQSTSERPSDRGDLIRLDSDKG